MRREAGARTMVSVNVNFAAFVPGNSGAVEELASASPRWGIPAVRRRLLSTRRWHRTVAALQIRPWYESDKAIGGIVISTEDITARKGIEEQRGQEHHKRSQKDDGRFDELALAG